MIDAKFYRNKETGAVVYGVAGNVEAADLELLQAGVTDGAAEKHVPFVTREANTVTVRVGEVAHPMLLFLRTALSSHSLSLARSQLLPSPLRRALRQRLMSTVTFMVFGRFPSKSIDSTISISLIRSNGAATCSSVFSYYTCLFLGKNKLSTLC